MKKRTMIMLAILLMIIGFAAVSTTLFINGQISFVGNENDFKVYFSEAKQNDILNNGLIQSDGKEITYSTKKLELLGDTDVLEYKVRNDSTQYDAKVSIQCTTPGTSYVTLTNLFDGVTMTGMNNTTIKAGEEKTGKLTVELIKTYIDENDLQFSLTCELYVDAIERTNIVEMNTTLETYSLAGYILDSNEQPVTSGIVAVYSNTQHLIEIPQDGYIYVDGLEYGTHEIYLTTEKTKEELLKMTKKEIEEISISKAKVVTPSDSNIAKMSEGYKIKDFVLKDTDNIQTIELKVNDTLYTKVFEGTSTVFYIDSTKETTWTNIGISNNAEVIYNNGIVTVTNITGSTKVFLNDNLKNTISDTDDTLTHIVVLKNIEEQDTISIKETQNIDLNLNNKKITFKDSKNIATSGNLNIYDGSLETNVSVLSMATGSKTEMNDVNVLSTNGDNASAICNNGVLKINNSTVEGPYAIGCHNSDEAETTIYSGKIISNSTQKAAIQQNGDYNSKVVIDDVELTSGNIGVTNLGSGETIINGGTYTTRTQSVNNRSTGNMTINGGTFTRTGDGGTTVYEQGTGELTINGGIFVNEGDGSTLQNRVITATEPGIINIHGGTFIANNNDTIINNHGIINIDDNKNKVYIYSKKGSALRVTNNTPQSDVTIKGNKADKCTNKNDTTKGICFYSDGDDIYASKSSAIYLDAPTNLTLEGGTFIGQRCSIASGKSNKIKITNSELGSIGKNNSFGIALYVNPSTVDIYGEDTKIFAEGSAAAVALFPEGQSVVNIYDGTYESVNTALVIRDSKVNIHNGMFNGEYDIKIASVTDKKSENVLNIYKGKFTATKYNIHSYLENGTQPLTGIVKIYDGEFSSPINIMNASDGVNIKYKSAVKWNNVSTPILDTTNRKNISLDNSI